MTPPSNAGGEGREVLALRTALVDYAMHYGPRCRECADHDDICPMSGMACGERRKATEFVVDALIYGASHGYCPSSLTQARELHDCRMALGGFDPERKSRYWTLYPRPARENADDRAPALVEAAVAEMRERAAKVVEADSRAYADPEVAGHVFSLAADIRALPTPSQEASNVG